MNITLPPTAKPEYLISQVESLRVAMVRLSESGKESWLELPPRSRQSAQNLLHYLALRSCDLRPLQDQLSRLGLSSLGRAEPHVLATIDAVLHNLYLLSGKELPPNLAAEAYAAHDAATGLLEQGTARLLGLPPQNRRVHIIVTMSAEAADDYLLVHQLLECGMNCMRINCAHEEPSSWSRIIRHLRNAERATGKSCRVLMDLAGPKLRTGAMEPAPAVLRIKPKKAATGHLRNPAHVWLTSALQSRHDLSAADAQLTVDPSWLAKLEAGDQVHFRDARGANRSWRITRATADGCWAEVMKTAYVNDNTVLHLRRQPNGANHSTAIGELPMRESVVRLRTGDVLLMSGEGEPGKPAYHDRNGELLSPGRITLCIPEIYRDARLGETVHFDDGRITGIIEKLDSGQLQIRITHTRKPVEKLAGNKGVNFPDTFLDLPALGSKDLQDLEFAVRHADLVGLSFVNSPGDVRALSGHLQALGAKDIGVILKIETKRGFDNLSAILLEALKFPSCGVMIARGDLAVECGFERMAEVQEEILWLCEAAHIPVIWATQVLESLIKQGHASRAEITDAAMSQAAEGVMLNKGRHIVEAVKTLDNILQRMQGHHNKKRSMLRKLHLASERAEKS